jgi:hypothetical protein
LFHPWPPIFHSDFVLPAPVAFNYDSMRPAVAFGCCFLIATAAFDNYFCLLLLPPTATRRTVPAAAVAFDIDSVSGVYVAPGCDLMVVRL